MRDDAGGRASHLSSLLALGPWVWKVSPAGPESSGGEEGGKEGRRRGGHTVPSSAVTFDML